MEKILINEINRLKFLMNINKNIQLLNEATTSAAGIIDDLLGVLVTKSSDDIAALGFRNADEVITLVRNFPTAAIDDQATIIKTILENASEAALKNVAKNIIDDTTTFIGSQVKSIMGNYTDFIGKYPNITAEEWVQRISKDLSEKFKGSQIPSLTNEITKQISEKVRVLKKPQELTIVNNKSGLDNVLTKSEQDNISFLLNIKQNEITTSNVETLAKELENNITSLKNTIDTYPNKSELPNEVFQKYKELNTKKVEVDNFMKKSGKSVNKELKFLSLGTDGYSIANKITNYSDRYVVMVNTPNGLRPFYQRTGGGGADQGWAASGNWVPFYGVADVSIMTDEGLKRINGWMIKPENGRMGEAGDEFISQLLGDTLGTGGIKNVDYPGINFSKEMTKTNSTTDMNNWLRNMDYQITPENGYLSRFKEPSIIHGIP